MQSSNSAFLDMEWSPQICYNFVEAGHVSGGCGTHYLQASQTTVSYETKTLTTDSAS